MIHDHLSVADLPTRSWTISSLTPAYFCWALRVDFSFLLWLPAQTPQRIKEVFLESGDPMKILHHLGPERLSHKTATAQHLRARTRSCQKSPGEAATAPPYFLLCCPGCCWRAGKSAQATRCPLSVPSRCFNPTWTPPNTASHKLFGPSGNPLSILKHASEIAQGTHPLDGAARELSPVVLCHLH